MRRSELPTDVAQRRESAAETIDPEDAIAVNTVILRHAPDDTAAMNRLGRAYEAIRSIEQAEQTFRRALAVDPSNAIASGRLRGLGRRRRRQSTRSTIGIGERRRRRAVAA
jgi:predicted TPR repeat methyltransferase